ncbi:hypothetical protein ACQ4PT_038829 [Festuca glaucescens]
MDSSGVIGRFSLGPVIRDMPPVISFIVGLRPEEFPLADAPGFIPSIDDALARHAADDYEGLDYLEISLVFRPYQFYIARLGKESFVLEVPPCGPPKEKNEGTALELPASAVGETLALTLGNATLTLPAPDEASFHALTELLLSHARIVDGNRLGELLSSPSFPNLEKLRLEYLVGVAELDLCVEELEELTIVGVRDLRCLVVNAPFLRTLRVTDCSRLETYEWKYKEELQLGIWAPMLDAFTCSNICKFPELEFDPPDVREIGELPLWTHGHGDEASRNEASVSILNHCEAARRLHLHLHVPNFMNFFFESPGAPKYSGMLDYESILVGEIPKLPNITALTVTISTWSGHSYAASLASLIAQCVNLEELHIHVKTDPAEPACSDEACLCNKEGGWENQDFSLERLRNLDIAGIQGLDYENRLLQMMLAGAPAIEIFKVPPSLGQGYETFLPANNSTGRWITCGDGVYRWTPN